MWVPKGSEISSNLPDNQIEEVLSSLMNLMQSVQELIHGKQRNKDLQSISFYVKLMVLNKTRIYL